MASHNHPSLGRPRGSQGRQNNIRPRYPQVPVTALIWPLWDLLSFRCLGIPGSSLGFLGSLTFTRPSSALDSSQGHEDVDQAIGEAAGEVAQHEYDAPEHLVQILDGLGKSARAPKPAKSGRNRQIFGETIDQSACWKVWVERLGIHLKRSPHI